MREREKQLVGEWPTVDELLRRKSEGWTLVAMEWEREAIRAADPSERQPVEIPYGLRVSGDGFHLEDDPVERRTLMLVLNGIVDDRPISRIVSELNDAGLTNRRGKEWTASEVFELLPRLIEAGPSILTSADWIARRKKMAAR